MPKTRAVTAAEEGSGSPELRGAGRFVESKDQGETPRNLQQQCSPRQPRHLDASLGRRMHFEPGC